MRLSLQVPSLWGERRHGLRFVLDRLVLGRLVRRFEAVLSCGVSLGGLCPPKRGSPLTVLTSDFRAGWKRILWWACQQCRRFW